MVKAVEEDKKNSNIIVDDIFNWFNIRKNREEFLYKKLINFIKNFIIENPSSSYKPPTEVEEIYDLFVLCLKLGYVDLSNTAQKIAHGVFFELANQTRKLRLGEERWNPLVNIVQFEEETKKDVKYNPLFGNFKEAKKSN